MFRPLLTIAVLALSGTVAAQVASYSYIPQGKNQWPPGAPWLTALNLPKIGTTFRLRVPSSYGSGHHYVLATGVSNPGIKLNGWLGSLFTSAEIVIPTPPSGYPGKSIMNFPIPNSTAWLGVKFYQQVATSFWTCTPGLDCALSQGGVGIIGR